ncbi:MAG: T9SS type A sorting domain-containing protein [FCB group bacterium]|jgi:hypothetical protein
MKYLIFLLIFCNTISSILFGQTVENKSKVLSSGGGESSTGYTNNFVVIGEQFVNSSVSNSNIATSIGFLFNDRINNIPFSAPALNSPPNYSTNLPKQVTFLWISIPNCIYYNLIVSENHDFSSPSLDTLIEQTFYTKDLYSNKVYYWKVRAINDNDTSDWSDTWQFNTITVNVKEANNQYLLCNYPNPFSENTIIKFVLPQASRVKLTISELNGRELIVVADRTFEAGISEIKFKAIDYNLSNGIYFYTISVNGFRDNKKMVLLK